MLGAALWLSLLSAGVTRAEIPPSISFDSFNGIYHLSRDSQGLSLLTAEETIVADFSSNGYYGITRQLPKQYQNQSVDVKVLSIVDAAGNAIPYKIANDNADNLVITTGDPAIMLSGSQTFKLTYQTKGVINLSQSRDEFLLNVNGRGWDQPFGRVNATLFIPASFRANLTAEPTCYTAVGNSQTNECNIKTRRNGDATVITAKAGPLVAHQALILKLEFTPSTFTNNRSSKQVLVVGVTAICLIVTAVSWWYFKQPSQDRSKD